MTDHLESIKAAARETELELEIARLNAEIESLRGDDPTAVTSRFLTMAAQTVDRAVADARREADEIIVEISAEAEARRDEATRVAAEAEALAEQMLADADRAREAVEAAAREALAIKAAAEAEADAMIARERENIALETKAVAEIRSALDEERASLESYHESLQRRVTELAASMVTFMHDELPASGTAELLSVPLDVEVDVVGREYAGEQPSVNEVVHNVVVNDEVAHDVVTVDVEIEAEGEIADEVTSADVETAAVAQVGDESGEKAASPWGEVVGAVIPHHDRIVDVPDSAIDEIPAGPPFSFDGGAVAEDNARSVSGGLFSRMRSKVDEGQTDEIDDFFGQGPDGLDDETSGLFEMLGSRLGSSAPPSTLAEALATDDIDDHAFREFLDGDDAPDPSREWLLRPEQS